jgi:hypothetical protein
MNNKKPLKAKRLKIIDHLGTLYATFDGSIMWEVDKVAYAIMRMCDGTRTLDQIAEDVARKVNLEVKDVKVTLNDIFKEMEKLKFIVYV